VKLVLSVALVTLAILSSPGAHAQGRPAAVETAEVSMRALSETITVFGEVIAERQSAVATRIAGIVANVPIRTGIRVSKGDVLARMDTERLEIELARAETERAIAEAGIEVATTRLERARRALNRAQDLRANSTIADAQLQDRVSDFAEASGAAAEAEARLALAENAIERAGYNLKNSTVRAPFAGVVLEVSAEIGQYAVSGSAVATLLDTTSMEVVANVPATYVGALTPQGDVSGRTDTQDNIALSLVAALPTEFTNTRTRPVVFRFSETPKTVAVGQPVTLDIPVGETRDVVVVPKDALVQSGGSWSAFVNEDGSASPRRVEIGAAIGETFEVISGLQPGDEVVVRGNERLRPGQSIMVAGEGGPPGSRGAPPGAGTPDTGANESGRAPGSPGGPPNDTESSTKSRADNAPARG